MGALLTLIFILWVICKICEAMEESSQSSVGSQVKQIGNETRDELHRVADDYLQHIDEQTRRYRQ